MAARNGIRHPNGDVLPGCHLHFGAEAHNPAALSADGAAIRIEARSWPEGVSFDLGDRPRTDPTPHAARELRDTLPSRDTPERLAFFAGLRADATARLDAPSVPPSRDAVVGARLDAFRDGFSGPFLVDGAAVTARPMFRMNGGANEVSARQHARELRTVAAKA